MSYYKQTNLCNNYKNIGLTNNSKFIDPFIDKTSYVGLYNTNNHRINSYEYLNNNFYPYTKSYNNIINSYKHYITYIIDNKKDLISNIPDKNIG